MDRIPYQDPETDPSVPLSFQPPEKRVLSAPGTILPRRAALRSREIPTAGFSYDGQVHGAPRYHRVVAPFLSRAMYVHVLHSRRRGLAWLRNDDVSRDLRDFSSSLHYFECIWSSSYIMEVTPSPRNIHPKFQSRRFP